MRKKIGAIIYTGYYTIDLKIMDWNFQLQLNIGFMINKYNEY